MVSNGPDLSPELADRLALADDLLTEAFAVLLECMPPILAHAIATQVIDDLAEECSEDVSKQ